MKNRYCRLLMLPLFLALSCDTASPADNDIDTAIPDEAGSDIDVEGVPPSGDDDGSANDDPGTDDGDTSTTLDDDPAADDPAVDDILSEGDAPTVGEDTLVPDSDTPDLCDYKCPFDIEPRRTVLGLPASAEADATMPLWAVLDDGSAAYPQYLTDEVDWISLDTGIVTVDAAGVLTPVAAGSTFVRADYQGHHAYAEVTVAGTLHAGNVMQGIRNRTYLLYVPASYDGIAPLPLVLGLHGGGGSALGYLRMSQLDRAAHDHGFFALYPDGASLIQTWNGGNCCGKAVENGIDDVGFIRQLLETIAGNYAVDGKRIYTSGLSNGGIMSHRLACEAADIIAAAAPIAGGLNRGGDLTDCSPVRPVPVIMFHGTTDENYPIEGGVGSGASGVDFYPVVHPTDPDTLGDWIALNGAAEPGSVTYQKGDETCVTHAGAAPVVMCTIDPAAPLSDGAIVYDGGGHSYPGGMRTGRDEADVPSKDIDANDAMWEFFSAHSLP